MTLMKKDRKLATMATRMLKDDELQNLIKGDRDLEKIVKEIKYLNDEELWQNPEDNEHHEKSKALLQVTVDRNFVIEAATKVLQPLRILVTPLEQLLMDEKFKKAVPEVESVKLGLDVIDGLFLESKGLSEAMKESVNCCYCAVFVSHYHDRYQISKAAKLKANHIQDLINKCPLDRNLTIPKNASDMKQIPSQFSKVLESRTELLHLILRKLEDDNMDIIGVYGMGGTGKTTLVKEVLHRARDKFEKIVMVEVSQIPNILHIQEEIALSIGLSLPNVDSVAQRALRLYNQLTSNKEKKTIVILDNIWKKLNLNDVGIPTTCKLLLTTRNREVCRAMGVQADHIHEAGLLNTKEARDFFKSQAGDKADTEEFKNVLDRLVNKCGGLPLAIVATANTLKDKDLPQWLIFADKLDKPTSSQVEGVHHETYLILETSYKYIESEEKRLFFLLASLSPIGSSVSIEKLMRYGIGLDLFQHVDKLSEAIKQANEWVDDLVSSSMLLIGDSEGYVKIHDVVRACAILFAAKDEGHEFMVEAIPRWLNKKSFGKYTAISMQSGGDFSRLNGVEADKLQILLLKGNLSLDFPDSFFEGMSNLEVLALSKMNFCPRLPASIGKLKKLRTLHLESCRLGDIKVIGEFLNLVVLSLRDSFLDRELPTEIGTCCNLSLLDMTRCKSELPLIPPGILDCLFNLEGLYMLDGFKDWAYTLTYTGIYGEIVENKYNDAQARANELNNLNYLNALEMVVESSQLPSNGQFVKNLDKFKICVDTIDDARIKDVVGFHRILSINNLERESLLEKVCLKVLLQKADWLHLDCNDIYHLVPDLDEEGFRDLIFLKVGGIGNLRGFCDEDAPSRIFDNLQHLIINASYKLQYILPLAHVPCNLTDIEVLKCESLKFFFIENGNETCNGRPGGVDERGVIELPFLKSLKLRYVPTCQSLLGTNISDDFQEEKAFFNRKIGFPCLELFSLKSCYEVVKLWSKDAGHSGFQNLRKIKIAHCLGLSCVGSPSIFSALVQLESLTITNCMKMHEVITEETEESEVGDQIIVFPHLKQLTIQRTGSLQCFYGGRYKLEFPSLKSLRLGDIGSMNSFCGSDNSSTAFFSEEVYFPCLEELQVSDDRHHVKRLWDWDILMTVDGGKTVNKNPVPKLTDLTISSADALMSLPSIICQGLTCLNISCIDNKVVFSSSRVLSANENFVCTYFQLPRLEDLRIRKSDSLEEFFEKENCDVATLCRQLKTLYLSNLPVLNLIPLDQFNGLCCLRLDDLSWEYVISADTLVRVHGSLQQLEVLEISNCHSMEVVILDDIKDYEDLVIEFPRLKQMSLDKVNCLGEFSSCKNVTLRVPSLECLVVKDCPAFKQFCSGPIVAPNLITVHLQRCDAVKCVLSSVPNRTLYLPSLECVEISKCGCLESFSPGPVEAPKLRDVSLNFCSNMKWFLSKSPNQEDVQKLPCFEKLEIGWCWNIQSFASGHLVATNLTHVTYDVHKYSLLQFGNLDKFLQSKMLSRNSQVTC